MDIGSWKPTVEVVSGLVTTGAILVGGFGAYLKFFKGRVFHSRLELQLSSTWTLGDGTLYLAITACVRNTGTSNIALVHSEEGEHFLEIEVCDALSNAAHWEAGSWQKMKTLVVFQNETNIEAGECLSEEKLVILPLSNAVAYRLSLGVRARKNPFRRIFRRDCDYHRWKHEKIIYSP